MRNAVVALALTALALPAHALQVSIRDAAGLPLPQAMLTLKAERPLRAAGDDNGYPAERTQQRISPEITAFAGADGRVQVDYPEAVPLNLRVRVPGYQDLTQTGVSADATLELRLKAETDPAALAAQQPANAWFAALDFGGDQALKKTAMEQCSFCHQQGSFFMRRERSEEEWQQVMERMIGYGARPSNAHQAKLIEVFQKGYSDLREHPEKVLRAKPWEAQLAGSQVRE
jgi:virginiamycin B lyase